MSIDCIDCETGVVPERHLRTVSHFMLVCGGDKCFQTNGDRLGADFHFVVDHREGIPSPRRMMQDRLRS